MNGEFKDTSLKEEAWKLCKDFLSGPWKEMALDEFRLFEVRGGLSNTLYRCALPENAVVKDPQVPKEILLRLYGPIQDDANVIVTEAVTFMLLSERKLGPKLYGLFPKGRLEEFIPSRTLSSDDMRRFSISVAREMAKIHALEVPVRKVPDIWQTSLTKWLNEVKELIESDKENFFLSYDDYMREMKWLSGEMKRANSPAVFCHNDLQGGNILYREDSTKNGKPHLMLIDFEFGGYNYRGFDIANHLAEWCFDYDTPEYPHYKLNLDKFPSRQEQTEFCTAYLEQLSEEGVRLKRSVKEEAEKMVSEITIFTCACHLMWSLWSIKMVLAASLGFGHKISDQKKCDGKHCNKTDTTSSDDRHWKERMEHAISAAVKEHSKTRRKLFQKFKEQYLTSTAK